jgi:hypothetical protein
MVYQLQKLLAPSDMWMISGPVEKEAVAYLKDATLAFTWKD